MAKAKKATTKTAKVVRKKKSVREIPSIGRAYIVAGFNNTMVTVTDLEGRPVCRASSGTAGFRGTKKSTPFAATQVGSQAAQKALEKGIREVSVFVKGAGLGRNQAIKSLRQAGLGITSLADVTPIPHDGCRPKKRRRV